MVKVALIGSINVDIILKVVKEFDGEYIVERKYYGIGGNILNTGVALKRIFEYDVIIFGSIGSDDEGKLILRELKKYGISTEYINVNESNTGKIYIVINRDNKIYYSEPNANSRMYINDDHLRIINNTQITYISGIVKGKMGNIISDIIVWNPTIVAINDRDYVEKMLNLSNIIVCNEMEIKKLVSIVNKSGDLSSIDSIFNEFPNIKRIIVTLGEKGSISYIRGRRKLNKIYAKSYEISDCLDTTGAGDAFIAGYLGVIFQGIPEEKRLKIGNYLGALCSKYYGGITYIEQEKIQSDFLINNL